jgi:soluble lytic murein transglycosylase-like protein
MGTAYLNLLLSYCSSVITALAAYNARPTAVPAGGVPNFNETKNYLKRIEDCHKKKGLSKGR